jgi:enterochelin esterase-like enzyme
MLAASFRRRADEGGWVAMGLMSPLTLAVAVLLTVAAPVGCLALWNRLGKRRWVRLFGRGALILSCQALAVLLAGLMLNHSYGFYTSWAELFGRPSLTTTAAAGTATGSLDNVYARRLRTAFADGHGTVIPWVVPGRSSGVPRQRALVYLPAAYGDPAAAATRFPVVELLHGFPGRPESWTGPLQLQRILDAQIARRQSVPFIAVMPTQNLVFPRDTQCVDVSGGPRVDTFLSRDVHRAVIDSFRAATDTSGWALMGYSTGGYCAINLAMRHPDLFTAAVSLSGYARPAHDGSTGDLFGGSSALRNRNTPLWAAAHLPPRELSMLVITSRQDGASYRDTEQLAAAARAPLRVVTILLARGGHNAALWKAMEPEAFNWLSRQVTAPLAPIGVGGGLVPIPTQLAQAATP